MNIFGKVLKGIWLCVGFFAFPVWSSQVIQFPQEELATESVLPVFSHTRSVLNRNVETAGRFEIGGGGGMSLNDAFYNPLNVNIQTTYHFNEIHAFNLQGNFWMSGLSSYGKQIQDQQFFPDKGPQVKQAIFANYQFDAYYGKISLSKQTVMNLTLFGTAGLGMIGIGDTQKPGLNIGLGQNFYFSPNFALRYDLRLLAFKGPDTSTRALPANENPTTSDFEESMFLNTLITLGAVFLL